MIGFGFNEIDPAELFMPDYGSIILELNNEADDIDKLLEGLDYRIIGRTVAEPVISVNGIVMELKSMVEGWMQHLEKIFPTKAAVDYHGMETFSYISDPGCKKSSAALKIARPRVFIPVFPGTNCEYDSARAFERAGAEAEILIVKNLTPECINETIVTMAERIRNSQIIMFPGGFSAGDEPEGSGKFIATVFRNPYIREAVMDLLQNRDGLILGVCNGFQALIKLGLLPYGQIREMDADSPTLTFNSIGRHVSCMVETRIASDKSPWFNNVRPVIYTPLPCHMEREGLSHRKRSSKNWLRTARSRRSMSILRARPHTISDTIRTARCMQSRALQARMAGSSARWDIPRERAATSASMFRETRIKCCLRPV
jgi:phosphoribosylformylglycinamidine synthase